MNFSRLSSFGLALIWLTLGTVLAVTGTLFFAFTTAQRALQTDIWFNVRDFVVYDLFFGQVAINPAGWLLTWLPVIMLLLSTLPLYSAYQHLRYAILQDRAGLIPFAVTMGLLFVILLIAVNTSLNQLFTSWASRVEVLRAEAVTNNDSALVAAIDTAYLQEYRQLLSNFELGSGLLIAALIAFTLPLLLARPQPNRAFAETHLSRRSDQCTRCGLVSLDGSLPECVLCQAYYEMHIARLPLSDAETASVNSEKLPVLAPGETFQLRVTIEPKRGVPARGVVIVIDAGRVFSYTAHRAMTQDHWTHAPNEGQSHQIVLRGPEYLTEKENLDITLAINERLKLRQRSRVKRYPLSLQTRSDDFGSSGRPQTIDYIVERQQTRFEAMASSLLNMTNRGLRNGGRQLIRGSASLSRRIARTVQEQQTARRQASPNGTTNTPTSDDLSEINQRLTTEESDSHDSLVSSETDVQEDQRASR